MNVALRCLTSLALAGVTVLAVSTTSSAALEPYQMVRSLQLVQDRIAGGDHAALPMQRKLLEMIDTRLAKAEPTEFEDERNFDALLIYSMSGGNPETLRAVAKGLELEDRQKILVYGLLDYLDGNSKRALAWLRRVDTAKLPADVIAFLSLVKGSVVVGEDVEAGLRLFDEARLLSPGTLVEEAALRRSVAASLQTHDPDRFLRNSSQYVRRFLRSPYAAQFADGFVDGVVALLETIDLARVENIIAEMTAEQEKVIYLRLARRSAIEGYPELLVFASRHVSPEDASDDAATDQRAVLYSSIASVTSENVGEVLARLSAIDRSQLSGSDKRLLDAARAIANEVVSRPRVEPAMPAPDMQAGEEIAAAPTEKSAEAEQRDASKHDMTPTREPEIVTMPEEKPAQPAPEDALATDIRKRLDAVDALLKETTR